MRVEATAPRFVWTICPGDRRTRKSPIASTRMKSPVTNQKSPTSSASPISCFGSMWATSDEGPAESPPRHLDAARCESFATSMPGSSRRARIRVTLSVADEIVRARLRSTRRPRPPRCPAAGVRPDSRSCRRSPASTALASVDVRRIRKYADRAEAERFRAAPYVWAGCRSRRTGVPRYSPLPSTGGATTRRRHISAGVVDDADAVAPHSSQNVSGSKRSEREGARTTDEGAADGHERARWMVERQGSNTPCHAWSASRRWRRHRARRMPTADS